MARVQLEAVLRLVDVQINPQVFRRISQSVAGMPGSLANVNVNLRQTVTHANNLNRRLQQTTQTLSNSERAARLLLQRMAQFAILLPTFATLNRAIQGSVSFLFEFDSALRDIVRTDVSSLRDRMEEIGDTALRTAMDLGVVAQEVLNVTKTFVQAGLSIEDAQERARLAIIATQVSTLDTEGAVQFLITATNQFGLNTDQLKSSLDALVKVEDLAAVEAQDISEAFRTGGNSMASFGKNINDAIGLISALKQQSGKSGREIGTFFKTLQTRIFAAGESRDALEALGVEVENLDGTLRPTLTVLNDMKAAFDGLTEAQAANASKAIAGVRQFEALDATLKSLKRANELSTEASEAAGAVDQKRTVTDQKLEIQLGKLIAQGQAFAEALGDAGLEDAINKVLKVATKLLGVFTSVVDMISQAGGSITPLLALAGVRIGGSVLGFASGGAPGGGGMQAPQPGQQGFIGPLTQSQAAMASLGTDLKRLGSIAVDGGKALGIMAYNVGVNTKATSMYGYTTSIASRTLTQHTAAVMANARALTASAAASFQNRVANLQGATSMVAITLAASMLPKVFEVLEEKAGGLGGQLGQGAAAFTGIAGESATLAAQFAVLGPQAAGIAAFFGALTGSVSRFFDALEERIKTFSEQAELSNRDGRVSAAEFRLQGGGRLGSEAQASFIEVLENSVKGVELGQPLAAAIQKSFDQAAKGKGFGDLKIAGDELRESLLGNVNVIKALVDTNQGYLKSVADSEGRLEQFTQLQDGLADGTLKSGEAFGLLVRALGAGEVEIDRVTGLIKKSLSFEEFKAAQDTLELADGIRLLGRELGLAKLGPEALSDELVRLESEFLVTQEASERTQESLRETLNAAILNLGDVNFAKNVKFQDLLADLLDTPETFDTDSIEAFKEVIRGLPKAEREAAEDILEIVKQQVEDKIDLQKAENDMIAEQSRRRKALFDAEAVATQNAFEASRKFTAELMKFGDAVNTEVLASFQNLTLLDVEDVLAGTSGLGEGLQQVIMSAFADPITQAEQVLAAATASTQAELDILAKRLEIVNGKLEDSANSNNIAALTTEKRAIELQMETTKQSGAIAATEAKIKILEAEKEAAEEAAEREKERLEALEKLADASRAFDNELRKINQGFEEFMQQRVDDLLSQEADAQSELKDAQQQVLASTQGLAEAYDGLIQAQLNYNGVIAEAQIKSNLLARDIGKLTGAIFSFDGELSAIGVAFRNVLNDSNITLGKRIELERQLADETLAFLQQAKDEIVNAGIGIFGQTGQENQALGQGIAGLQFVAEQLGGSFEAFLNMSQGDLAGVSQTLLSLPAEFRQQILNALSFLPSTMNVGGFSVEQLTEAIGQVGAGVAPESGLPSIEELNNQQVEQLTKLQELALQDAQLQFAQVLSAQEQVAVAQEAVAAAQIAQERASQNLTEVRDAVLQEMAVLETANAERIELLNAVIATDDKNTLMMIEKEAQAFADQNSVFREVGDNIVKGIASAIGAKLAVLEATANVANMARGYIPNFAGGNLSPDEAAGLLRAASREKRAMPAGAGLAVANTSEAIIPMRYRGFVPNFQDGNASPIAAGISAIKQINETVVAAIARSVTQSLSNLDSGTQSSELLTEVVAELRDIRDTLVNVEESNVQIQANTLQTGTGTQTQQSSANSDVRIVLETNQRNQIAVSGLEGLREQISVAVKEAAAEQVDQQLATLLSELDNILSALQERGIISSLGQAR